MCEVCIYVSECSAYSNIGIGSATTLISACIAHGSLVAVSLDVACYKLMKYICLVYHLPATVF